MRILIASQTYYPGTNGQAVFTIRLAEGLVRNGHTVAVVIPSEKQREYGETLNGVQVYGLTAIHLPQLHAATYLALFPDVAVRRVFREFQPDCVHLQDHYPLCESVLRTANTLGVPCVGTNHFLPENVLQNAPLPFRIPQVQPLCERALWAMMKAVFNKLDWATTPTETAASILRQQNLRVPVEAISCGVDDSLFRPRPEVDAAAIRRRYGLDPQARLLVYIGRHDHEKRLDVLIDALAQLPGKDVALQRPYLQLALAGRGAAVKAVRTQIETLGLGARVKLLGYVPLAELPLLLACADAFAMPSPQELQSIATLEAMACAKPIVAANARALPELVAEGVNGWLFTANDVADALRCLRQFAAVSDMQLQELGQASFRRSRPHTLAHTLSRYEKAYHSAQSVRA